MAEGPELGTCVTRILVVNILDFALVTAAEGGIGARVKVNSYRSKPRTSPPKSQGSEIWEKALTTGPWCEDVVCSQVSAVLSTPLWERVLQRFGKRTSAFGICVSVASQRVWGGWGGSHGA
jgi:hypothetical protein